ncbi:MULTISPECIES: hypothetical protein [unclassified Paenibacillus]|uniref:hypothetical protein n=1 Tax=Paenibacillus TaxID=44249 RepID=UPI000CFD0BEC|nr:MULTISPECIES: hypothetical protein [unclassified Paenibacillus]PRA04849.1 hypothetical protein CQ043_12400 [Paenibacillus sp. MYb63]PRA47806.1 hypothetical protein CQ061_14430 [Paenibacillus sp. MYb67]
MSTVVDFDSYLETLVTDYKQTNSHINGLSLNDLKELVGYIDGNIEKSKQISTFGLSLTLVGAIVSFTSSNILIAYDSILTIKIIISCILLFVFTFILFSVLKDTRNEREKIKIFIIIKNRVEFRITELNSKP